jgi:rare lipoprotein A
MAHPFPTAEVKSPPSSPLPPAPVQAVYQETGIASWYGRDFHGRKTASGEIFDMYGLSAAHRILPLGAIIRVTNLDNFKRIPLKLNDRGPFAGNRVLEVSYAAARELGFAQQGTARVKIETFEQPRGKSLYTVVAAVFAEEESALLLKDRLSRKFEVIVIAPFDSNAGRLYRVRVGSYHTEEKAELIAGKLKLEGLEPFVMRKD